MEKQSNFVFDCPNFKCKMAGPAIVINNSLCIVGNNKNNTITFFHNFIHWFCLKPIKLKCSFFKSLIMFTCRLHRVNHGNYPSRFEQKTTQFQYILIFLEQISSINSNLMLLRLFATIYLRFTTFLTKCFLGKSRKNPTAANNLL